MKENIVLGGGCFWCIEAAMQIVPGVLSALPGYSAGETKDPNYEAICTGKTGHAEVVNLEFDPEVISLDRILELFFKAHDPTQLNRQGNDIGTQYRSIILWTAPEQKQVIQTCIDREQKTLSAPIVTQVQELEEFYQAEDYHIDYFKKNPNQAYCQFVVRPKVEKVQEALT